MVFALVKWISGQEKDTYTVLDSSWVLEVNISTFDNNEAKKCVVEWRVPATKKKHGIGKTKQVQWQLFDAMLIRISEKEKELQNYMRQLEREEEDSDDDGKRESKQPRRYNDEVDPHDKPASVKTSLQRPHGQPTENGSSSQTRKVLEKLARKHSAVDTDTDELKKKISELEKDNRQLRATVIDKIPQMMEDMAAVLSYVRQQVPIPCASTSSLPALPALPAPQAIQAVGGNELTASVVSQSPSGPRRVVDKVPVHPGSDLLISSSAASAVRQAPTATAMARVLLLALFDPDTLHNSNLKGGVSKRTGDNANRLHKLDEVKLEAIYSACLEKFPSARRGDIGTSINGKLTELRLKAKKVPHDDDADH